MQLKTKDYIFIAILAIGLALSLYQKFFAPKVYPEAGGLDKIVVKIGDEKVIADLPRTPDEMYKGLGERESMDWDKGMLFVHSDYGKQKYVMRGMLFDLDFIFIRDDKVVDIAKNVSMKYKGEVVGATDYNIVLEVNADWARRSGLKIGDEVEIEGL